MSKYVGKIITNQAPAGYSVAFNGSTGYLSTPDNAAFDLGSGDFTIEAWLYITAGNATGAGWISQWTSGLSWYFGTSSSGSTNEFVFGYTTNGSSIFVIASGYIVTSALNKWTHFAVTRSGTSVRLFVNGVQQGSTGTLSGTIFNSSDNIVLGRNDGTPSGWYLSGYMSNARVVKGTALYTAAFNPPTQLFPVTNTSLLTCQSPTIIDNSSNAFAITVNGNAVVSTFTPFAAYNPAPTSSNPLTPAPGVWTLDEALQYTQQGVWPSYAVNAIEDVFSTWLYTGNSSTQTITNGIDLSTKGGLVWIKGRNQAYNNNLFDTARGTQNRLNSNTTGAAVPAAGGVTSFNTNGFTLDSGVGYNDSPNTFVSWTFREQAKFFDVVTYTGNGSTQNISHNLGSEPGCVIIKSTTAAEPWVVWHRELSFGYTLLLNTTAAQSGPFNNVFGNNSSVVPPSTTQVTVGNSTRVNQNGQGYVMYVFAHNSGGFGAAGADNVISCGSYTGNASSSGPVVTLGYEPQWVLIKGTTAATQQWFIFDTMRGIVTESAISVGEDPYLLANTSAAETSSGLSWLSVTSTGFQITSGNSNLNGNGENYIYIAIRRGPMRPPLSGTSVFRPTLVAQTDIQQTSNGTFPPDFVFMSSTNGTSRTAYVNQIADRLRSLGTPSDTFSTTTDGVTLTTSSTAIEDASNSYIQLKANGIDVTRGAGWNSASYGNFIYYLMRRAPGFFDVVCYTGTGVTDRVVAHNLTIPPQLIITKSRSSADAWAVGTSFGVSSYQWLYLNLTNSALSLNYSAKSRINSQPTSTQYVIATDSEINGSGNTYVAYLFATVAGVSKVGSYTGTGTTQQINCGFTNGSRFVMIKRTDSTGDWYVWDSARGIVAGNDPYLLLNNTNAEVTNTDFVDTYSLGFELSSTAPAGLNASGGSYIFLAIA